MKEQLLEVQDNLRHMHFFLLDTIGEADKEITKLAEGKKSGKKGLKKHANDLRRLAQLLVDQSLELRSI